MSALFPKLINQKDLLKLVFDRYEGALNETVRNKLNTLYLYSTGIDGYQIAKMLALSERTVYQYLRLYFRGGLEPLFPPLKLNEIHVKKIHIRNYNDRSIFEVMIEACPHGHKGYRYTTNGRCVECSDLESKRRGRKKNESAKTD